MEPGACPFALDISRLGACCILKTLYVHAGNGNVNAGGETNDDLIVGRVIVRLDRTGPIILSRAYRRNGGIDLRVRRSPDFARSPVSSYPCRALSTASWLREMANRSTRAASDGSRRCCSQSSIVRCDSI